MPQLYSVPGNSYDFLFIAKGGGSANKTGLFQQVRGGGEDEGSGERE